MAEDRVIKFMVTRRPRKLTTEEINMPNYKGQSPLDLTEERWELLTGPQARQELLRFKVRDAGDERSSLLM